MPPLPVSSVFLSQERLHDAWHGRLDCAIAFTNIEELNPGFGRHMLADIYKPRDAVVGALDLGLLPPDATVMMDHDFMLTVGGHPVADQLSPSLAADPEAVATILATRRPVQDVAGEMMLAARFGIATWGHWLSELLPKVVVVENRFPGRFTYVLPTHVVHWQRIHPAYQRIHESLLAYGITDDRIFNMEPGSDYRFSALHALTPIWEDGAIHPQAVELMRDSIMRIPQSEPLRRVALLRTDTLGRNIDNIDELAPILEGRGFRFLETARMPFVAQAATFRDATAVAAVLGSAMTGLLYSPAGVKVLSMAPADFGDRFFYGLTQERGGMFVDLRGTVGKAHESRARHSSFHVQPAALRAGLSALFPDDDTAEPEPDHPEIKDRLHRQPRQAMS